MQRDVQTSPVCAVRHNPVAECIITLVTSTTTHNPCDLCHHHPLLDQLQGVGELWGGAYDAPLPVPPRMLCLAQFAEEAVDQV